MSVAAISATFRLLNEIYDLYTKLTSNSTIHVNQTCNYEPLKPGITSLWFSLPGILIPLLLGYMTKRKSACPNVCHGRPGVAIPMNAIEMRHIRVAYLIAFGATIPSILSIVTTVDLPFYEDSYPVWVKTLLKILIVFIYGTVWYPLFAIISAEILIGYILGCLYAFAHLVVVLYNQLACINLATGSTEVFLTTVRPAPTVIFLVAMIVYFPMAGILYWRSSRSQSELAVEKEKNVMAEYVRNVFNLKRNMKGVTGRLRTMDLLSPIGFVYPPRLLCSLLIAFLVLYTFITELYGNILPQLGRGITYIQTYTLHDKRTKYEVVDAIKAYNPNKPQTMHTLVLDAARVIEYGLSVLRMCFLISVGMPAVFSATHFPFILINYRRNVLLAYKGKYPVITNPHNGIKPVFAIIGFTRLVGYQAAYLCWGFIIQSTVMFFVSVFTAYVIIIPIMYGFGQVWLDLLVAYWPVLVMAATFLFLQYIFTRFFFTLKPNIAIDNRGAYFVWTYYVFFYDIFLGAISCLMRVFASLAFGLIFIGRIDVPVIPRKFEHLDPGFNIYSGFVLTEVAHSNPIMRTFLNILLEEREHTTTPKQGRADLEEVVTNGNNELIDSPSMEDTAGLHGRQMRYKWYLLYTLIKNDALQYDRKHRIDDTKLRLRHKLDGCPENVQSTHL